MRAVGANPWTSVRRAQARGYPSTALGTRRRAPTDAVPAKRLVSAILPRGAEARQQGPARGDGASVGAKDGVPRHCY